MRCPPGNTDAWTPGRSPRATRGRARAAVADAPMESIEERGARSTPRVRGSHRRRARAATDVPALAHGKIATSARRRARIVLNGAIRIRPCVAWKTAHSDADHRGRSSPPFATTSAMLPGTRRPAKSRAGTGIKPGKAMGNASLNEPIPLHDERKGLLRLISSTNQAI